MAVQIQLRRDTSADWISNNPTLAEGEIGYETDTNYIKIGDGSTDWVTLDYFTGSGSVSGGFTPNVQPDSEDIASTSDTIYFSGMGSTYVYSGTNTIIISSQVGSAGNLSDLTIDENKNWNDKGINNLNYISSQSISGGTIIGNYRRYITTVTNDYTAKGGDIVLVNASADLYVYLPATPIAGDVIDVKRIDGGSDTVAISGNGNTIDGSNSLSIPFQYQSYCIASNGTNYYVI